MVRTPPILSPSSLLSPPLPSAPHIILSFRRRLLCDDDDSVYSCSRLISCLSASSSLIIVVIVISLCCHSSVNRRRRKLVILININKNQKRCVFPKIRIRTTHAEARTAALFPLPGRRTAVHSRSTAFRPVWRLGKRKGTRPAQPVRAWQKGARGHAKPLVDVRRPRIGIQQPRFGRL